MKEKKVTVTAKGASVKQWSDLILELNLMKKAWRPYGVDVTLKAPSINKIITLGTSNGVDNIKRRNIPTNTRNR